MAVFFNTAYQILYIVAAVEETAVGGYGFSVNGFGGTYLGDFGQSDEHAFSIEIAESAFDVVFCV